MADVSSTKVVLVGAGNVATALALALRADGQQVVHVWSRTDASATALAGKVGAAHTSDLSALCPDADIYVLSVADAAVPGLAPQVVQAGNPDAIYLHTAGSLPLGIWQGAAHYGVVYPLQTFTKGQAVDMSAVPLFLEADSPGTLSRLSAWASRLSRRVMPLSSAGRRQLHLAAVFACNFPNCLYRMAGELLEECGVPFEALLPLIDETAAKVHRLPPALAQTGPAARGDEEVMRRHREMLSAHPDWQRLYELLSREIQHGRGKEGEECFICNI